VVQPIVPIELYAAADETAGRTNETDQARTK
jgi:hypothetical protein